MTIAKIFIFTLFLLIQEPLFGFQLEIEIEIEKVNWVGVSSLPPQLSPAQPHLLEGTWIDQRETAAEKRSRQTAEQMKKIFGGLSEPTIPVSKPQMIDSANVYFIKEKGKGRFSISNVKWDKDKMSFGFRASEMATINSNGQNFLFWKGEGEKSSWLWYRYELTEKGNLLSIYQVRPKKFYEVFEAKKITGKLKDDPIPGLVLDGNTLGDFLNEITRDFFEKEPLLQYRALRKEQEKGGMNKKKVPGAKNETAGNASL